MSQTKEQKYFERLDYPFPLAKWLVPGDTITNATASATPAGLTTSVTQYDSGTPLVWVEGGTAGESYEITVVVTTAEGRTKGFNLIMEIT